MLDAENHICHGWRMKTPALIVETLGVAAMASRLGVAPTRVRRARFETRLPALWYAAVCDMADEAGLPRPDRGLFGFRFGADAQ